ncbi:MAG: hypothetical protein CR982_06455 [Candidatus Cloacimonadota bacterium]|nr:MAG: hypothetical protein CR982_06455 [Candidatus Cloacimonadota bacterium]PIE77925.1 MAG: hypothetical protein CSA15_10560 [Candidatus Delongbacteria bacterium]
MNQLELNVSSVNNDPLNTTIKLSEKTISITDRDIHLKVEDLEEVTLDLKKRSLEFLEKNRICKIVIENKEDFESIKRFIVFNYKDLKLKIIRRKRKDPKQVSKFLTISIQILIIIVIIVFFVMMTLFIYKNSIKYTSYYIPEINEEKKEVTRSLFEEEEIRYKDREKIFGYDYSNFDVIKDSSKPVEKLKSSEKVTKISGVKKDYKFNYQSNKFLNYFYKKIENREIFGKEDDRNNNEKFNKFFVDYVDEIYDSLSIKLENYENNLDLLNKVAVELSADGIKNGTIVLINNNHFAIVTDFKSDENYSLIFPSIEKNRVIKLSKDKLSPYWLVDTEGKDFIKRRKVYKLKTN